MATGFGLASFSVYTDGELPAPERGDGGVLSYTATVKLESSAQVDQLSSYFSVVTLRPALGLMNQGTIIIEAGAGVRSLTIPEANGTERVFDAVLTEFSASTKALTDAAWSVDATWILLGETTP